MPEQAPDGSIIITPKDSLFDDVRDIKSSVARIESAVAPLPLALAVRAVEVGDDVALGDPWPASRSTPPAGCPCGSSTSPSSTTRADSRRLAHGQLRVLIFRRQWRPPAFGHDTRFWCRGDVGWRRIEQIATFFAPAVLGAICNRIESRTSTVFEGDFISPDLAAQAKTLGVRSLFLLAGEEEIRANFLQRDGDEHEGRARVSAMRSQRLADHCTAIGLPVISAQPFETLLERACEALRIPFL